MNYSLKIKEPDSYLTSRCDICFEMSSEQPAWLVKKIQQKQRFQKSMKLALENTDTHLTYILNRLQVGVHHKSNIKKSY